MKVVFQSNDIGNMTIIKSVLESSGIYCVQLDEYTQIVKPSYLQYSGGGRLAVADEQEAEARAIIEDYLKTISGEVPSNVENAKNILKCPECGSPDFKPTLLSIIFGWDKYKCSACGKKFKLK